MKEQVKRSRLRISAGTVEDIPAVLELIQGLARYERLSHQVKATEARLGRHGFGPSPYFRTLISRRGPAVVGYALYFFTYSTFLARPTLYIEDLYVLPEQRGQGAGKAMLAALARIALQKKCGRMEWAVLDWNRPAIDFYKRLGARLLKEWIPVRVTGRRLERLAQRQ